MWNTLRTALLGRWVLVGAMAFAYSTIGMGCAHDHDDRGDRAAYHDHDWDHHDYDHHDWDRDRY